MTLHLKQESGMEVMQEGLCTNQKHFYFMQNPGILFNFLILAI
jgi:hypothetical protein